MPKNKKLLIIQYINVHDQKECTEAEAIPGIESDDDWDVVSLEDVDPWEDSRLMIGEEDGEGDVDKVRYSNVNRYVDKFMLCKHSVVLSNAILITFITSTFILQAI